MSSAISAMAKKPTYASVRRRRRVIGASSDPFRLFDYSVARAPSSWYKKLVRAGASIQKPNISNWNLYAASVAALKQRGSQAAPTNPAVGIECQPAYGLV